MLRRLSEPRIDGVLFSSMDRFFRPDKLSTYNILRQFEEHNKLMICDLGILDPNNQKDQWTIQDWGNMFGADRKKIFKNTSFGIALKRKQGNCVSDTLPQGVEFFPDRPKSTTGHFAYTQYAHDVIKVAIKRIFLERDSLTKIAKDLGFKSGQAMKTSLRSRFWIGEKASLTHYVKSDHRDDGTFFQGHRVKRLAADGVTPAPIIVKAIGLDVPLVSVEDFEAMLAIFDTKKKQWTKNSSHKNNFLGTGLVYCACGEKMYVKVNGGRPYYICSTYYNQKITRVRSTHKPPCGLTAGYKVMPFDEPDSTTETTKTYSGSIRAAVVDSKITAWVEFNILNKQKLRLMVKAKGDDVAIEAAGQERSRIEKQLATVTKKKANLVSDLEEDMDTDSRKQMRGRIAELATEGDNLKAQLTTHDRNNQTVAPETEEQTVNELYARYLNYPKFGIDEKKELLARTFLKFQVDVEGTIIDHKLAPSVFRLAVVLN
jgi:hypothetical protein